MPRSAAIVYWVRSLVPSEKKSACSASFAAPSAAAGTSTMIPNSSGSEMPVSTRASSNNVRAAWSSARVATMGSIALTG